MPVANFDKYILQYHGKKYGRSVLRFSGNKRVSTKHGHGKCPYRFVTWFFGNCKSVKIIAKCLPEQYVNIYNYNFSYSYTSNILIFHADVTWYYTSSVTQSNTKPLWQKLNDTT